MNTITKRMRTAWKGFPKVFRNLNAGACRKEKEYVPAMQGSDINALILVDRVLDMKMLDEVYEKYDGKAPVLLPVLDPDNQNKIPLAMACVLADKFGWDVEFDMNPEHIMTGWSPATRIAASPVFEGKVSDRNYVLVDSNTVFGSTLANLRGYVESNGGKVLAAMTLEAHEDAQDLVPAKKNLDAIKIKFGDELDDYFKDFLGFGVDCLTNGECKYLVQAPSLEAIKNKLPQARAGAAEIRSRTKQSLFKAAA